MVSRKFFLILVSVLLFLFFIYFSYLVSKEVFRSFDFDTTVRLQNYISRRWDFPFSTFSQIGSFEITGLIWLGILAFAFVKKYYLTFLSLFLFVFGSSVEIFGKLFVYHPSPPFMFYRGVGLVFPTHYIHTNYSYPSGHIFRTSFLISFLFLFFFFKIGGIKAFLLQILMIIFLFFMALSRIYLGEHWFSDVVGGMLLGSSLGLFCGAMLLQSKRTRKILDSATDVKDGPSRGVGKLSKI